MNPPNPPADVEIPKVVSKGDEAVIESAALVNVEQFVSKEQYEKDMADLKTKVESPILNIESEQSEDEPGSSTLFQECVKDIFVKRLGSKST